MKDKDLYAYIKDSLEDETNAKDEYEEMIELTEKEEELTDEEKSLIVGMIFKIQTDEKTHKVLLSIIKEVLENKHKEFKE